MKFINDIAKNEPKTVVTANGSRISKTEYSLAMAIGQDAGNRNMRRNNRTAWNEEDRNVSIDTVNRVLGI